MRLGVAVLVLAGACATARPEMGDRATGPDWREACPGASWSSAVQVYDLAGGPFVVEGEGVEARPGERVVAVSHRTRFADGPVEAVLERSADGGASFTPVPASQLLCVSSNTGRNGELGPETRECVGRKQIRLSHVVAGAPAPGGQELCRTPRRVASASGDPWRSSRRPRCNACTRPR